MNLPGLIRVRQRFAGGAIGDVEAAEAAVRSELAACGVAIRAGSRIAIAVGSRGIAHIAPMVRQVVAWVRSQGAEPFIVPAMGSHGGGTSAGQREVLASYGIVEAYVGAPILSSMDVVSLPQGDLPIPLFFDKHAHAADGTILINRIKPHTSFHGPYESGLMKMITIGLGKHAQATAIHGLGVHGLRKIMPEAAKRILAQSNILLGLAVVENAYDETLSVCAVRAASIPEEEPALLELARGHMPRLPVDDVDILVVDEMGKDISGVGMDTNVIGRLRVRGQPEPDRPNIAVIIARDLTQASHGNAVGVGLADIVTRRLFAKIDFKATYANIITSTFLERGKVPLVADTDRQAIDIALRACGSLDPANVRLIRIRDTLHLDELLVSPAVLREIEHRADIDAVGPCAEAFGGGDDLGPFEGVVEA